VFLKRHVVGKDAKEHVYYSLCESLRVSPRNPLALLPPALPKWRASFARSKASSNVRPIWHRLQPRIEAHILIAFLGYCLWVCLKQKLKAVAGSLTPAQVLHCLKQILMVEVCFDLRHDGKICLPRITQPETAQLLVLHHLGWSLPEQPPPKIYRDQNQFVWTT
jgi:hypothetical protein